MTAFLFYAVMMLNNFQLTTRSAQKCLKSPLLRISFLQKLFFILNMSVWHFDSTKDTNTKVGRIFVCINHKKLPYVANFKPKYFHVPIIHGGFSFACTKAVSF